MHTTPRNIPAALASFEQLWSPRILTSVNDYDVRIGKVKGEHIWHNHTNTDEFFMVLDGTFHIGLRDEDGTERTVTLHQHDVFTVPKGMMHRPFSPDGASILMFEPTGTSSTGDTHDAIPDHVDSTTGHAI
jgi:mannose-6-phosphate isomerase-like protein (cupin superfamily)